MSPPVLEIAAIVKDYHGLRPLRIERLTLAAGEQVALLGFDEPAAEMMATSSPARRCPIGGRFTSSARSTAAIDDSAEWLPRSIASASSASGRCCSSALTVIQNLAMPFTLEIEPPPDAMQEQAAALAREVGLPASTWDRPVGALDAAARLRVRLARALAFDPAILLLEHPTRACRQGRRRSRSP